MNRLAILGASGHGKVVADIAELTGWSYIDFFDDAWPNIKINSHWSIVGDSASLFSKIKEYSGVFVAIGNNKVRFKKQNSLLSSGAKIVNLIHPDSIVSQYVTIGKGVVVMAGVVVNVDTGIGNGSILNTCCSVDHDCVLSPFVHISPGARLSGSINVGSRSWIGVGASVRQGIEIGDDVTVGAGAVVVSNLPNAVTAVGVPARFKIN